MLCSNFGTFAYLQGESHIINKSQMYPKMRQHFWGLYPFVITEFGKWIIILELASGSDDATLFHDFAIYADMTEIPNQTLIVETIVIKAMCNI